MAADPQTQFHGGRDHLFEEVDEVLSQAVGPDIAVHREMLAQFSEREALGSAGQAKDDVPRQPAPSLLAHGGVAAPGLFRDMLGIGGLGPLQDMEVEGGEVDEVEPLQLAPVGSRQSRSVRVQSRIGMKL